MGTLLNRRRYMGGGSSLPYDAEVEYIRCTGTQIIDTGFAMGGQNSTYGLGAVKVKKRFNVVPANWCGDGGNFIIIGKTNNKYGFQWSNGRNVDFINTDTNWHEYYVDVINGYGYIDNVTKSLDTRVQNTTTFKLNGYQVGRNSSTDTEILQLFDRNYNLVFDGIAVRVGQNGGMYDRISGNVFGINAGFIIGPDKTI